ncbi:complex I subunit 5 family protein [Streptomyces sp. NPDC059740]|uniref:complex I subunit 5 family protein n=1 Tax=Streptomyces sp. NPDC059740 TaxID=3346926 RepID=UPI00364AC200
MPSPALTLPGAVVLPLGGAALLVLLGRLLPRTATDLLAALFATATLADLALLWHEAGHATAVDWLGGWRLDHGHGVGIVLVGDRTGVGLALVVALLVCAVVAYSWRYFDEPPRRHAGSFPALLLLFEGGMCGFALTGDLFNAFVFFELMGVVAYALTGFRIEDPRPLQGALTFGVVNSLAAYTSLLGIGILYARTGELGMAQTAAALSGHRTDALVVTAFVCLLTGFLVKAAVVPFHFWLPDAHAVAPTPVCMLLSGVMVELGCYGALRVQHVVFGGSGGIAPATFRGLAITVGVVTALVGSVMCWQQRHLKRLLAFSTIGHTGLFLVGAGLLDGEGTAGTALYVAGHAGVKAALFGLTGVLLDRHGSVDEHGLHGRGRDARGTGLLFAAGALALAGLPPFGTGLGKAVSEHAAGTHLPWLPVVYVLVSAVTGGAVLRVALRVFAGAGPPPRRTRPDLETSGDAEAPEVRDPRRPVPRTMTVVPALLLAGALAAGVVPGVATALAGAAGTFTDRAGYLAAVLHGHRSAAQAAPPAAWTASGLLLGLLSALLAGCLAALAVWGPAWRGRGAQGSRRLAARVSDGLLPPLRRLHSGHLGDYAAWFTVGVAALLAATAARL